MPAESSDFQSEMKAGYSNNNFPCVEAPTFSRGFTLLGSMSFIFGCTIYNGAAVFQLP